MPNIMANLVRADWNYSIRLGPYIFNSFAEVFDRFPEQLGPIEELISPIEEKFLGLYQERMKPHVDNAIEAAENWDKNECIADPIAKLALDFIGYAEYPFFKYITENTYLAGKVRVPDDTEIIVKRILNTPLCKR